MTAPEPVTRETLDDLPVGGVITWQAFGSLACVGIRTSDGRWDVSGEIDPIETRALLAATTLDTFTVLLTREQHEAGVREAVVKALRDAADEIGPHGCEDPDCRSSRCVVFPVVDADWLSARADREEART